ncbi:MAG: TlpA family protein disulfide reductase [Gammaproteobacteria bacterium]|nr:TlpA family protein disulfide reductase [Gammaproteobacteria bacterium]
MQRSFIIFTFAFLSLMAGALFYAARIPVENESAPEPMAVEAFDIVQYPAFTLKDLDGVDRDFSEWHGRHRLLNFWATWCAPCRREIPLLKEFQEEQGDDGILVMGIAVDFAEDVAVYAKAAEFNYPILIGQEDAMAVAESSGLDFIAMPFTMIVSKDGEFLNAYLGELHRSQLDDIRDILTHLDNGDTDVESAKKALDQL